MTEAQKREQYLRMETGEIPWGPIDGEHPGAVGNRLNAERSAGYRDAPTAEAFIEMMANDPLLANSETAQQLVREYRANPDDYERRGGTVAKKKNPVAQFMVNNPWTIPAAVIGGSWLGAGMPGIGGASGAGATYLGDQSGMFATGAAAPGATGTGAAVTAGAAGVGSKIKDFFTDPENLVRLGAITGTALASRGGGGGAGGGMDGFNLPPQVQQLLDMQVQRAQRVDPLHSVVTNLAMQRLPNYAKGGQ